ncbi:hypothetical protein [Mycolicibacterium bacteremicum]|nr:hypothetical protein [Mycolicibacterium bacteremicum]
MIDQLAVPAGSISCDTMACASRTVMTNRPFDGMAVVECSER